jgi:hypothetical protein
MPATYCGLDVSDKITHLCAAVLNLNESHLRF